MLKRKIQIVFIVCVLFLFLNLSTSYPLNFLTSVAEATPPFDRAHTTHPPGKCHNLQFNLVMPVSDYIEDVDMQVIRGVVPIQIEMHPRFKGFGRNDGYGVFISVDYDSVFQEDGIEFGKGKLLDLVYQLDTTKLNNGTHLININVNDYYDHSGSLLMKVIVDN